MKNIKNSDSTNLENQLDKIIYKLYRLTKIEITKLKNIMNNIERI